MFYSVLSTIMSALNEPRRETPNVCLVRQKCAARLGNSMPLQIFSMTCDDFDFKSEILHGEIMHGALPGAIQTGCMLILQHYWDLGLHIT